MEPRRRPARPLVVVALLVGVRAAVAGDDWSMEGGDAGRTSSVDCAPVRREPVLLWSRKIDGGWIGEPVVRKGVLFVVTRAGGGQQVVSALDVATGEVRARSVRMQCSADAAALAASDRAVHVGAPGLAETYLWSGTILKPVWQFNQFGQSTPAPFAGLLFSANSTYDATTGGLIPTSLAPPAGGRMPVSIALHDADHATIVCATTGPHERYPGLWMGFEARELSRCSAGGRSITAGDIQPNLPVAQFLDVNAGAGARVAAIRLDARAAGEPGAWMFWSSAVLTAPGGLTGNVAVRIDKGRNEVVPVVSRPAARGSEGYSFDGRGDLVVIRADATFATIAPADSLPRGPIPTRPSIAGGVLLTTGWAFDLESGKVLWTLPAGKLRLVEPMIPAGDGLLVVRGAEGEIAVFADPDRPANASKPTAPPPDAAPAAATPPPEGIPSGADGVLLRDGRQYVGFVTLEGDAVRVDVEETGERAVLPLEDVAIAQSGQAVVHLASERDVLRALTTRLGRAEVARYEVLIAQALELSLASSARDYLAQARRWGITEVRAAEIEKKIAAKQDPSLAEPRRNAMRKKATPVLDAIAVDVRAAMEWCRARDLPAAGTALWTLLERDGGMADADSQLVARFIPAGFAENVSGRPVPAWKKWAPVLLENEARLLAPNDPARRRILPAGWKGPVLAFRTPHLIFFSRTDSAEIAGPCLSRGEAAVRGLRELLGVKSTGTPVSDDERLEVRLHATKEQYVAEANDPSGLIARSLGYFSPSENVSRFYVPEVPKGAEKDAPESISRNLFKTLAHELTHHYVEARWIPSVATKSRVSDDAPGYWVVEGIARFMEDQIVDADARGLTFQDPSVLSVTLAAQLAQRGVLFDSADLLDLDYDGFRRLDPTAKFQVELRSGWTYKLSEMNVFYEQAGTMVFFLRNACGPKTRDLFVEYLRDVYVRDLAPPSWKALGFESGAALDRKFKEWMATLKL